MVKSKKQSGKRPQYSSTMSDYMQNEPDITPGEFMQRKLQKDSRNAAMKHAKENLADAMKETSKAPRTRNGACNAAMKHAKDNLADAMKEKNQQRPRTAGKKKRSSLAKFFFGCFGCGQDKSD